MLKSIANAFIGMTINYIRQGRRKLIAPNARDVKGGSREILMIQLRDFKEKKTTVRKCQRRCCSKSWKKCLSLLTKAFRKWPKLCKIGANLCGLTNSLPLVCFTPSFIKSGNVISSNVRYANTAQWGIVGAWNLLERSRCNSAKSEEKQDRCG